MNTPNGQNSVTAMVTRLALLLAIVVGLTPAIAYWTYSYTRLSTQLESNLRVQALTLTDFITIQPDTWDLAHDRLLGTLDRHVSHKKGFTIHNAKGEVVVDFPPQVKGPFLVRTHTVHAFGQPAGSITGQEPFLQELIIGIVVLITSLGCAWLLWVPIRGLPLAALAAAERDLRARDRYQRALLNNFPFMVWLKDVKSRYLAVNTKFMEATGLTTDENLIGMTMSAVTPTPLAAQLEEDDQSVLAEGRAKRVEQWVDLNAQRCCLEIYKSPVSLDGEIIGTVGYAQDITHRKQSEDRLHETLRMLEETQALSRFGGWEYDVGTGGMTWSNEVYRLFGVEKDFDVNDIRKTMSFYTQEYAEIVSDAFINAVQKGIPYDLDVQILPANGKRLWVRTMGTPQLSDGKVTCIRGNFMDITEKKSMEIELQLANDMLEQRVSSRTKELAVTNRDMNQILSSIASMLFVIDKDGRVNRWNKAAEDILREPTVSILGQDLRDLNLGLDSQQLTEGMEKCRQDLQPMKLHNLHYESNDGKEGFLAFNISPILAESGQLEGFLFLGDDITDLKFLESKLSQAQRLESIGQLAAGIAHEINTPIQYIGDSVTFLMDAFAELLRVLDVCAQLARQESISQESFVALAETITKAMQDIDYAFLQTEIPKGFHRVQEGIDRVSTIVQAMKRFSHPGGREMRAVDINKAVESTLTVSHNEWKYVADLVTDLAPELPPVVCFPGDLNQVLLNVIVNAAHTIADVVQGTQDKGRITVSTRLEGEHVAIRITDTGTGIAPGVRDRIFDPFFTTKEVGKGTGQGLAIAYDIVVKKHGGTISFETEPGHGTTFIIKLPIGT